MVAAVFQNGVDGRVAFVTGLCVGRMWVGDAARKNASVLPVQLWPSIQITGIRPTNSAASAIFVPNATGSDRAAAIPADHWRNRRRLR